MRAGAFYNGNDKGKVVSFEFTIQNQGLTNGDFELHKNVKTDYVGYSTFPKGS